MENINGNTCLITGAACGLGFEFAKLAVKSGYDLILIDIDSKRLEKAKLELCKAFSGTIDIIHQDLGTFDAANKIISKIRHKRITLLINNAGFGLFGMFNDTDWALEERMINLHVLTLTHLTKYILKDMLKANNGKIMNVASMAAFQPGPLMAIYYATKAYMLSFSEALSIEVKNTGVSVTAFCPGPTKTRFQEHVNLHSKKARLEFNMADKAQVARCGYRALIRGKSVVVPGFLNKILAFLPRILPRDLVAEIVLQIQLNNRKITI